MLLLKVKLIMTVEFTHRCFIASDDPDPGSVTVTATGRQRRGA